MINLVLCDGLKPPHRLARIASEPLLLRSSSHTSGTPNIRIPSLPAKLHGAVPNAAIDLLRIAAFAYWADQMVSRPVDVDVDGEKWKRSFLLVVPVLEPDLWREQDVGRALTRALNYGTGDEWAFQFEAASPTEGQQFLFELDSRVIGDPDSALLFSGGADSLCAAVEEAACGRRPMLISHSPSARVKGQQESLRRSLEASTFDWHFPRYSVEVSKLATAEKERTQRSRGFLYSSIGASVAASFRIKDVVLADNGFVSVGLPLNGQTVGSKMSRTTHPRFQYLFNRLTALVLPDVRVRNPLLFRTRAEALELLSAHSLQETLSQSSSCAASRVLPGSSPHCGVCSQCLDRRIGVITADLGNFDSHYQKNVFLDALKGNELLLAESYARLMRTVAACTSAELLERFVELTDCAFEGPDGAPADIERIVEMIRRQADTALLAIEKMTKPVLPELLSGKYSTTCLVRLSLAGTPDRKFKNWQLPDAETIELSEAEQMEFGKHGFKVKLPLLISGERSKRRSNVVEIGGRRVDIPDAEFVLLLRLVQALYESADGFVPKGGGSKPGGLTDEEGVVPGGIDQAIDRLRKSLQLGRADVDPRDLIEVSHLRVRLSTHLRFVTVRRDDLVQHPHPAVRSILAQIPAL